MTNRTSRLARRTAVSALALATAAIVAVPAVADPLVIGHRGASADRPEHTIGNFDFSTVDFSDPSTFDPNQLGAYALAILQGADFIEPDLVTTSDGVLIARHEPVLDGTTDVASRSEFAARFTTKNLDGEDVSGWFAEDFTLAEIKTLRAIERIPGTRPDNTAFDGQFEIPTLAEVIQLVEKVEQDTGRQIGIYPETKHPTFFDQQGVSLEEPLINTLVTEGFTDPNRIFIQSFEVANLIELQNDLLPAQGLGNLPLVQLYGDVEDAFINAGGGGFSVPYDFVVNLANASTVDDLVAIYGQELVNVLGLQPGATITYADLNDPAVFMVLADEYAEGVGPWKNSFLLREAIDPPVDGDGDGNAEITSQLTGEIGPLLEWAQAAGLLVHPYTLRPEEPFLTLDPTGEVLTLEREVLLLAGFPTGGFQLPQAVDGFFVDAPGIARATLDSIPVPAALPLVLFGVAGLILAARRPA